MRDIRACAICERHLPLGANPLIQGSATSRVIVIGQAPGKAAHESGTPWDDRSGDRLRDWLGLTTDEFYDKKHIALMPMGFCFPGTGKSGDLAPRPECAPEWHDKLLAGFRGIELSVYAGRFAFERYLGDEFKTITEAAEGFDRLLPGRIALPHPSPRNNLWLKKNPWFERDVLPALRARVRELLDRRG